MNFPASKTAAFMSMEADVACNPITSFHALRSSDVSTGKRNQGDMKRNKVSVLNTQAAIHDESRSAEVKWEAAMYVLSKENPSAPLLF